MPFARELAQEASDKFYPRITDKSERLRRKRQRQKQRWLDLARFHDDLKESFETQVLDRIWLQLAKAKVAVVPNLPAGNLCRRTKCSVLDCPSLRSLSSCVRRM